VADAAVRAKYGLAEGATFEGSLSAVSVERALLYAWSASAWVVEQLLGLHKSEVDGALLALMPHTARWYKEKALRFQFPGRALVADTDRYDNSGLTEEDIAGLEVVKFCAVTDKVGELQVKVAKGAAGARAPLSADEVAGLSYYLSEVRDAGVRVTVVNRSADRLTMSATVYYNPLALDPAAHPVEAAVREYASGLAFNGVLSTTRLVDVMQGVAGVMLVQLAAATVQRAQNAAEPLGVQRVAESGYWVAGEEDISIAYTPYSEGDIT
jgi:hypothetical protein